MKMRHNTNYTTTKQNKTKKLKELTIPIQHMVTKC